MEEQKPKGSGMEKIATFIVDKRNLFFSTLCICVNFQYCSNRLVKVENVLLPTCRRIPKPARA